MTQQDTSRHLRLLIYFFPALIDMVAAQFLFVNTMRLVKMGASASASGSVTTIWSVTYLVTCLVIGRLVTPRNAAALMLASCLSLAALAGLGTILPGVMGIYILTALGGGAAALFFPPFQTFMKAVDKGGGKSLSYSTGLYTFAWSAGYAVGPFISGFLMETGAQGWKLAYACGAAGAVVTAVGILHLKHLVHVEESAVSSPVTQPPPGGVDYGRFPDLAWLAWIGAGAGVVFISVIRAVFPSHAVNTLAMGDGRIGTLFFLLSITQALTGIILCRSRIWMYRALPVSVVGGLGMAGILCLAFGASSTLLGIGVILFGVYSGSFFFYLVFHAIAHPVRSAGYVAVNESVVGIGGILGPLIGGGLSDRFGFAFSACACATVLLAITAFQAVIHRRTRAGNLE
jgi:MFS family permease